MKKLFSLVAALFALIPMTVAAWTVPDEVLHYALRYKWGFMELNAGICELSTYNIPSSNMFRATLTGKSIDMLGHYYAAGDTIIGEMLVDSIKPRYVQHLDMEKGDFIIGTVTTNTTGPSKNGPITQRLKNGQVIRSRVSEYGGGVTIDLLSVFYYIRQIPYQEMKPGQTVSVSMTDKGGKDHEVLSVLYHGPDKYAPNPEKPDVRVPAYYINLQFEDDDNPNQKDEMEVWISTDSLRVPLYVTGTMKVGQVEARYLNSSDLNLPEALRSKLIQEYSTQPANSAKSDVAKAKDAVQKAKANLTEAKATAKEATAKAKEKVAKAKADVAKAKQNVKKTKQ